MTHTQTGFSYTEVLIAAMLISIVLVPAIDAITPNTTRNDMHIQKAVQQHYLIAKVEDVLADNYSHLETEALLLANPATASALYSDVSGTQNRRLVYLSQYDGDNADNDNDTFTGVDQGLLWVRVTIENTPYEVHSLISESGID